MKSLLLAALLIAAVPAAQARLTAGRALLSAPVQVTAPLLPDTSGELMEYADAGRINHKLRSAFGAQSSIVAIDSMQVTVQTDSAQTLSLTLLPMKGDTIIAVIQTLTVEQANRPATHVNDSRLTIYSRQWQPLPKLWSEPGIKQWLNDEGRRNRQKAEDSNPFIMAEYSLDPKTGILTLFNRSEKQQYLETFLRYKWTGKGFKLIDR